MKKKRREFLKTSATAADRVKRGSTTISLAPLLALASVTHLKPQG